MCILIEYAPLMQLLLQDVWQKNKFSEFTTSYLSVHVSTRGGCGMHGPYTDAPELTQN